VIVTAHGATYVWQGSFDERAIPEQAGFEWCEPGSWQTQRHGIAAKMSAYFDPSARALADRAIESAAIGSDFEVPTNRGNVFLPYQRAGVSTLASRLTRGINGLLADEMRLGKSIQTIGVINVLHDIFSVIIVCPATLKLDWKAKLELWLTTPSMTVGIVWPDTTELPKTNIIIVNYDLLHRWVWPGVDLLVVDEAHLCKNPKARRTKKMLAMRATHKLYLTGTPALSRPMELYPLIKSLDPKNWPTLGAFGVRYCGGFVDERGWNFEGASNLEELHDRLRATIMVRRLRSEVWKDLPLVRREIIELPLDGGPARRAVKQDAELQSEIKSYEDTVDGLRAGQRVAFERGSLVRHETALAKIPQLVEAIVEAMEEETKIVVFGWHVDVIQALVTAVSEAGFGVCAITGETPVADRMNIENVFRTDDRYRVFIGNMAAAGVGMDLSVASRVIFAELDWVPGVIKQAEDRCQHPSKRDTILVQHYVLDGSIDANMARALVRKQDILDRTLDGKVDDKPLDISEVFCDIKA